MHSQVMTRAVAFAPATGAAQRQQQARRQRLVVLTAASQGFSSKPPKTASSSGSSKKKELKMARYLDKELAPPAGDTSADGWIEMPDVDVETSFISKPIKAIILATGRALCLYKVDNQIYATDASSTAFKYPLADASILSVKGKPAVEVALDGTVYDLASGSVLSWCPKNTLVRKVLGGMKDRSDPQDLPVYPVQVRGSKVFVKFI